MMLNKSRIFWIFVISFIYALPTFNKWWFPYDEGLALTSIDILMHGGRPYVDFVSQFGPIQPYILANIFRIFGSTLEVAHLYIIFLHAVICTTIVCITYKLCRNLWVLLFVWLVSLSCMAPRMGAVVTSIWPFIFFSILSMFFFVHFIEQRKYRDLIIAGLLMGLSVLSRFELGIFITSCEIFVILFLLPFLIRKSATEIITTTVTYLGASLFFPAIFYIYLLKTKSIDDFLYSVSLPYTAVIRYGHNNFPLPCFDPRQIFYNSLYFITVNQHYIPLLVYFTAIMAAVYLYRHKRIDVNMFAIVLFLSMSGSFIFSYAYFGADVTHTMPIMFPALMLSGFVFAVNAGHYGKTGRRFKTFIRVLSSLIAFLLVLLFIKNSDKYIKNAFVKPYRKDIVLIDTGRGKVYIPKSDAADTRNVLSFIRKNTLPDEKMYICFDNNKDLLHGGEPMLYFLSGRRPATKHFTILPGVSNRYSTQREIIDSLKDVNLILVTEDGKIMVNCPQDVSEKSDILDSYIRLNFLNNGKVGKYHIYKRKNR